MNQLGRRLRHLPAGLLGSAAVLVVAVPVAALYRGGAGAAGAAAGVCLVAAGYTASSLVVAWVDAVRRPLVMQAALATYVVKFVLLGLGMAALARTGWTGLAPMGFAIIAAVVAWTSAQAWWTVRAKIPYVDFSEAEEIRSSG
jgi:hypothetical protein